MTKAQYPFDEEDCERVNRTEMVSLRWCVAAINSVAYAKEDLDRRLQSVPYGRQRWAMMLGTFRSLMQMLLQTVPYKQRQTIWNVCSDMELRMVPKYTNNCEKCIINIGDLSYLVNHAKKDICTACVLTDSECRKCELYQILESITPQKDWGESTVCPYMRGDWMDR